MQYLSEYYAVNIFDPEEDSVSDWHGAAYDWENAPMLDSADSVFGDFGIKNLSFEKNGVQYSCMVANHLRACLDMFERGHHTAAQGMRENFIGDESLTPVLFEKVLMLEGADNWEEIDRIMGREYGFEWLDFRKGFRWEDE